MPNYSLLNPRDGGWGGDRWLRITYFVCNSTVELMRRSHIEYQGQAFWRLTPWTAATKAGMKMCIQLLFRKILETWGK